MDEFDRRVRDPWSGLTWAGVWPSSAYCFIMPLPDETHPTTALDPTIKPFFEKPMAT